MALHVTMLLLSFVTLKVNSSANAVQASIACAITIKHDETLSLLLIQAFHLPKDSRYLQRSVEGPKETVLMNFQNVKPLLEDVEWDIHRDRSRLTTIS